MAASSNPNSMATAHPGAGTSYSVQEAQILANSLTDAVMTANTLTSTSISKNLIQTVTVSLTAANIIAMYAAPVVLIAAPGSGLTIVLLDAVFKFTATATQFTAGGTTALQIDSTANGAGVKPLTTFADTVIKSASSSIQQLQSAAGTVLASNKGIYISNDTAAFATGTGTATVNITYRIIAA